MKIEVGLFGFGKTGSIVAKEIIESPDCHLKWVVRKSRKNQGEYASHLLGIEKDEGLIYSASKTNLDQLFSDSGVDVIIDFSASGSVDEYKGAAKYGTRFVSAISNYDPEDLEHLKELSTQAAVLYSPNITLGINFLIAASKVLQKIAPKSDIEIVEEHFREKPDVSGTALRIAEDLNLDKDRCVNSVRVGGIIGKHEVIFGLPNQTIRIIHESLSRAAFGQGAIYAAKWLMKKKKGLYTMEQALAINLG